MYFSECLHFVGCLRSCWANQINRRVFTTVRFRLQNQYILSYDNYSGHHPEYGSLKESICLTLSRGLRDATEYIFQPGHFSISFSVHSPADSWLPCLCSHEARLQFFEAIIPARAGAQVPRSFRRGLSFPAFSVRP